MANPNFLDCGLDIDKQDDNSILRSMKRILAEKQNFTEMCLELLNLIPEDLKDQGERNLLIMISESID